MIFLHWGNTMIKKCLGCGVRLQDEKKDEIGYVVSLEKDFCERCFRIQHYNEYKFVSKSNDEFINILKNVNKTDDLVLLLIDIFDFPTNLDIINKYLSNEVILVITKYDLLKPYLREEKLLDYIQNLNIRSVETLIISSAKNYNLDLLMEKIKQYQKSNNVYVIGNTNAGKSTLINKIIYNYTDFQSKITTSMLPSTTLANIKVKINDKLTLIDTPGLLEEKSLIEYVDSKKIKKVIPKTTIKPKTYQIKIPQTIVIEDLAEIYFKDQNNITVYISNELRINRIYNEKRNSQQQKHVLSVPARHDIVIKGLGFIKIINEATVEIYTKDGVDVYIRKSLI